jgi:hypothetical protein
MKRLGFLLVLVLALSFSWSPTTAKILLRVSSSPMPAADKLGVHEAVLVWPVKNQSVLALLSSQGYRIFLQCEWNDVGAVVDAEEHTGITGVIVANTAASNQAFGIEQIRSYAAAHPKLNFRLLVPGGKQPQMKGRLVVERNGILHVSSPSSQPWLDTNLALVRLAQSANSDVLPVLYDFPWNAEETPGGAWHPDEATFALAIAEADAVRSDVVIDLPDKLQKALSSNDPGAWSLWNGVRPYLDFSSQAPDGKWRPVANIGAIVDNAQASYEALNLMARHNLAFEAVRPSDLNAARLTRWNSVVVFCSLGQDAAALLRNFAQQGAIVIFVNSHDDFPWHSTTPTYQEAHSATYRVGKGQIVELSQPVVDPENFARDLRRLIGAERSVLALWNSLTTLVTGYREEPGGDITLYLVNYADQPDNVQVQVKGRFAGVQLESPEEPRSAPLSSAERTNGFTEFTIPVLRIAARVHLHSAKENSAVP